MVVRRILPALVAAAMVTPGGGTVVARAADPHPAGSESAALAEARKSGRRVEVMSQRSETRDVFANPDGTVTATFRTSPVRVRRGAGWLPVDTTLRSTSSGVEPVATTRRTVFSGGGGQPLVRLYDGSRWLELRWPAPLPEPVLSKGSATYAEVLPGVDLRMRATADGFAKVFVVKNRTAAANPKLAELRFGVATEGLTVAGTSFRDRRGESVLAAGAPMMWDSAGRYAVGDLRLRSGQLSVVPDRKLLTDPGTRRRSGLPTAEECSAMLVDLHAALHTFAGDLLVLRSAANDIPIGVAAVDRDHDVLAADGVLTGGEIDQVLTAADRWRSFVTASPGDL